MQDETRDEIHDDGGKAVPGAKRAEREARLAEQLRANLQRRKQQARGRAAARPSGPGSSASDASGDGS